MTSPFDRGSLPAWLEHLEALHPKKIDLGLDRVRTVASRLGVLATKPRTLTVAGTNGKGSCVAVVNAVLRGAGYSVGVYTSPHLIRFNERIVVNGAEVADSVIVAAFEAIDSARGEISLSYFEFATLAGLWIFHTHKVDWQILEVGLGGRLDAVNIVDADAAVITSIGIDHTEWLGETREAIAPEKAGVARPSCPAIVADAAPPASLLASLDTAGAEALMRGRDWSLEDQRLTLPGGQTVQLPAVPGLLTSNVAAAVVALGALNLEMSEALLQRALGSLRLPGRQQQVEFRARSWWFDVAHNGESVEQLAQTLAQAPKKRTLAIFGAMADKPLHAMIRSTVESVAQWHLPASETLARAAQPAAISAIIREHAEDAVIHEYESPTACFRGVLDASCPGDRILVFGSFVIVGAQLEHLNGNRVDQEPCT